VIGSYENDGNGGITFLRSNGSKITTSGAGIISPTSVSINTTGAPQFSSNFAD
jgi:hypothetical protein